MMSRFSSAVESGAKQRQAAYDRGDVTTTVVYDMVPESRAIVLAFDEITTEVDDFCRFGDLLTLATPQDLVALRRWSIGQFVRQVDGGAPSPWNGPLD